MSKLAALSGNQHLQTLKPQLCDNSAAEATVDELRTFLQHIDEIEPNEIITLADKFSNNSNNESNPNNNSRNGVLSAETILHNTALSPTGAQVISTLKLDAGTVEQFQQLRTFQLTPTFRKLSKFVPAIQESYGRKQQVDGQTYNQVFNGYYSIVDPLMLAGYVPYIEELVDLNDSQIAECLHQFQEVDGYPTLQGIPLWERQEWERIEYYNLFKLYRDMRYAFYNESDALLVNRSLAVLAQATRLNASTINYLSEVYSWNLRIELYDAWMAAMQQRRISIKRSLMLDRHSKVSQELIRKAFSCLSKHGDKMSPKDALEMLKLGLAYERISLGLLGDKPNEAQAAASPAPLLSIVNQTNNSVGPMQVNNESRPAQQLQENMKKPDTLLGILSVLQRSGAFETLVQKTVAQDADSDDAISDNSSEATDIIEVMPSE